MKAESFKCNQKLKGIYIYKLKEREREMYVNLSQR